MTYLILIGIGMWSNGFMSMGRLSTAPPTLHDVWLDEHGRFVLKEYLDMQQCRNKYHIREQNRYFPVPDTILLNTNSDDARLPQGITISYYDIIVDSSWGRPHSESEGDYPDGAVAPPFPDPNISPEGASAL